jgi:hypothetical protein
MHQQAWRLGLSAVAIMLGWTTTFTAGSLKHASGVNHSLSVATIRIKTRSIGLFALASKSRATPLPK